VDADNHDRLIAVSTGAGVSLGAAPDEFAPIANPPIDVVDSPDLPPLHVVFGATRGDDGLWRLPTLTPQIAAPHGALHLGAISILLEAAAMEAVDDHLQVQSWTVTMLRPGTHGPFRAEALALGAGGRVPVQLTLFDEGREDRAVATVLAVYAEAPAP
jgi:hypothetical protein